MSLFRGYDLVAQQNILVVSGFMRKLSLRRGEHTNNEFVN